MKYMTAGIVFAEIPDEITLELGISNCPYHCEGCHSPFLQSDMGEELTWIKLKEMLEIYKDLITCLLISGGDSMSAEYLFKLVKLEYPKIKTAWYSGGEELPKNIRYFDYVKLGPYKQDLGGLKSPTTNQKLYKVQDNGELLDITSKFWK